MNRVISFFVTLTLVLSVNAIASNTMAHRTKVVFINPGHQSGDATGPFWADVSRFMQAAADDLNIELINLYANRDHILMQQLANTAHQYLPDYVIIVNEKGVGLRLMKALGDAELPTFTLLNDFSPQELDRLTAKQRNLLIGSLTPDNFSAGKRLMADLFSLQQMKSTGPYELLLIRGDYSSAAAIDRYLGAKAYIEGNNNIHLLDSPVANWSKEQAYKTVKGLLQRQPIDIIWAANDPMAFGASLAVKEANRSAQVSIGGFNWDKGYPAYPIDVSYGGHVTLGAKALVMLKDHQLDMRNACQMNIKLDIFQPTSSNELDQFLTNSNEVNLKEVDFSRFAQIHEHTAKFDLNSFIYKEYTRVPPLAQVSPCP